MQINNNYNSNINFGSSSNGVKKAAKKSFNWLAKQCNVDNNGSLERFTFVSVASLFMLGGRVIESRSNDERREVLVRDVPGVVVAVYGAPLLNSALGSMVTKKSGIPIISTKNGKNSILNSTLASQSQIKNWFSNLKNLKNPLGTLAKSIDKNGGNIKKAIKKFGFEEDFNKLVKNENAKNSEILDIFEKNKNSKEFKTLENKIKNVSENNAVLKTARRNQASVKLAGIGFTATLLGYFLPRLNIITTRNKYQHNENQDTVSLQNKPASKASETNQLETSRLSQKQKNTFRSFIK